MNPQNWLRKALAELRDLAPWGEASADDAWRALVLVARLLASPSGPVVPTEVLRCLPVLYSRATPPDATSLLLERLSEELSAQDDPEGPLLDVLLDIDDVLGVLTLSGDVESARTLLQGAVERLRSVAARVHPLEGFAMLRRETVRPDSDVAALWAAIVHASEDQPVPVSRPPRVRRNPTVLRVPSEALRPQAWTRAEARDFASQDGQLRAWLYEEAGRLRLELRSASAPLKSAHLVVLRRGDERERATLALSLEVAGHTVYADLGALAGPGQHLHSLLTQAGLQQEEAELRLRVTYEP